MNMPGQKHLLTKTAYLYGLVCDRLFWIYQNDRELLPEVDDATQAIFDQGHQIGNLAKSLYPGGIEIDWSSGHEEGVARTDAAIRERKPIFEAGFQDGSTHARADILNPAAGGKWDLIEVKSSSGVKEAHLPDVAFQKHVYEGAGIRIGRCFVMHVDKTYVRKGELDVEGLLVRTEVTGEIKSLAEGVSSEIRRQLSVMAEPKPPEPAVGPGCPAECILHRECWSFLPDRHVFSLNRAGKKAYDLMGRNILEIKGIPDGYPLTQKQAIQVACEKSGNPHIEPRQIRNFIEQLEYPLYLLDFETFMMGVPPYEELSPYEQVPFQYSLHVLNSPGSQPEHYAFLSDAASDPRPEILSQLKTQLGRKGSIVAFNAPFEMRVLKSCAWHFSKYQSWLESILPRFVDLLIPFREFYYYHPRQNGSASLKAVLPALTDQSYVGLEIADGETASLQFRDLAFGSLSASRIKEIRKALEAYCHQDTEAMIRIVRALEAFC
jgi:hypothetical protein